MKKTLLIFTVFIAVQVNAQNGLTFNKRFIECEDKWVTFQIDENNTHTYGFIYIDSDAGLTLNLEGSYKVESDSSISVSKLEDTNAKVRLDNNNVRVAIIPETMFVNLQIDTIPSWLKHYKNDVGSIKRLYKWGFMYNGWGLCEKALGYLLEAKSIDPEYKGLLVEIAYSYNCLKKYDSATTVLKEALKINPMDAYANKEYIYTMVKQDKIDKAIIQYIMSVDSKIDDSYNAENCFNIVGYFYRNKDVDNFKIWVKQFKKWPNENDQMDMSIKIMKKELK